MPVVELDKKADLSIYTERNWNVMLHNDDWTTFETVINAIITVIGHTKQESMRIMLEAHNNGISLVITTNKIVAETYKEQLEEYGLTISLEQR
jgi:ATP-dependent Clp protease adaptor protein ClpS